MGSVTGTRYGHRRGTAQYQGRRKSATEIFDNGISVFAVADDRTLKLIREAVSRFDASPLRRTIDRTRGSVIVAGHAYAGAVVASANEERVKALVYVAALAPDEGETVAQVFHRDESHPRAPKLAPDADGFIWMPDESFAEAFAQDATAEQIALCRAVQRPISVKCIQEPAAPPAWKTKPAWYLLAEEDRMINPKTQRFMAERMKATIRSFAVDHTPLLTAPDKVADIIREAAKTTLG